MGKRSLIRVAGLPLAVVCALALLDAWLSPRWLSPLNAQESVESRGIDLTEFVLHPECEMELVACEPQVVDPIAARFDETGRLWVVEMRDYPTLSGSLPQSKIKILRDLDGDGFFETATVFADHLMFPTGLQPWRGGVIVTLEGRVVYLADRDGDLRCDEEQLWYQGFAAENTQLRANDPTFGPDGQIYVANGLRNGEVRRPGRTKKVSLNGQDFRFDPLSREFQSVPGHGQFGLAFDTAGYRYVCTNRNPLKRVLFESEYLSAAAGISISQSVVDVAAAGADSRLYPLTETWTTSNLHANQFTAACGVLIYQEMALPDEFQDNAFVCDPTANLVHREIIGFEEDSVAGRAGPGRPGVEFLASRNPEFRPVNLNSGPDGGLYVVDMRRAVIEHPQFMPPELQQRPDLLSGNDRGRIYRIVRRGFKRDAGSPRVDPESHLFDLRGWWREQAHRLLVEDTAAVDWKRIRAGMGNIGSHPNGILRALSLLHAHDKLEPVDLDFAISHYASAIRGFAMRLCEGVRPDAIRAGIMDESDPVRFQALLSAAAADWDLSVEELKTAAIHGARNRWIQQAWLMAARKKPVELLDSLLEHVVHRPPTSSNEDHVADLCVSLIPLAVRADLDGTRKIAGACFSQASVNPSSPRDGKPSAIYLERIANVLLKQPDIRRAILAGELIDEESLTGWRDKLRKRIETAIVAIGQRPGERVDRTNDLKTALELVALISQRSPDVETVALETTDPDLRAVALRSLHYSSSDEPWLKLVDRFRSFGFAERAEILRACQSRSRVARQLLQLVEQGRLRAAELGGDVQRRLKTHPDPDTRSMADRVLVSVVALDRQEAFQKYRQALELAADARRGRPLFAKNCAACHQLGTLGNRIGPDISDTRTKTKSQLLLDIVQPNAAIDNNYVEYLIETVSGRTFSGIILENNASGITLRQTDNEKLVVPHPEIERLESTGKSLMPVGLEQGLTLQEMADLISYLQNWRYLEQNIPYSEESNAK